MNVGGREREDEAERAKRDGGGGRERDVGVEMWAMRGDSDGERREKQGQRGGTNIDIWGWERGVRQTEKRKRWGGGQTDRQRNGKGGEAGQTDRQRNGKGGEAGRRTDRETERVGRRADRQRNGKGGEAGRQTDRETERVGRRADRQTEKRKGWGGGQTDRQTEKRNGGGGGGAKGGQRDGVGKEETRLPMLCWTVRLPMLVLDC